jgi:hypothetical protein
MLFFNVLLSHPEALYEDETWKLNLLIDPLKVPQKYLHEALIET